MSKEFKNALKESTSVHAFKISSEILQRLLVRYPNITWKTEAKNTQE